MLIFLRERKFWVWKWTEPKEKKSKENNRIENISMVTKRKSTVNYSVLFICYLNVDVVDWTNMFVYIMNWHTSAQFTFIYLYNNSFLYIYNIVFEQ